MMSTYNIYIIDDEPTIREGLTIALEADYNVAAFAEAKNALQAIKEKKEQTAH